MGTRSRGQPNFDVDNTLNYFAEGSYTRVELEDNLMRDRILAVYSEEDNALLINNQIAATAYDPGEVTEYLTDYFDVEESEVVSPSRMNSTSWEELFDVFLAGSSEEVLESSKEDDGLPSSSRAERKLMMYNHQTNPQDYL